MVLRGGALAHRCWHANLKVFGDVLYVGLCEAHSACQHEAEKEKCDEEKQTSALLTLHCGVQGLCAVCVCALVLYLWLCVSGLWSIFCPCLSWAGTSSPSAGGTPP